MVYATEREAEIEIAEMLIAQLQQFIVGERAFNDALSTSDFILPAEVWPNDIIQTEDGRQFGAEPW